MNIQQLAESLNKLAQKGNYHIAALPELRKKYLGKKKLPSDIFTSKTIFQGNENYAFHNGGRDEFQFNVGEETVNGKLVTRYALCLSLEPSQSLVNPTKALEQFRKRFNQSIKEKPEYFEGFSMWYYTNNKRSASIKPVAIDNTWYKTGNFIAIGKIIEKPISEIGTVDMHEILKGFDDLLPLYRFCVLDAPSVFSVENRIAKVTWNENDWIYPSGPYGKSMDVKAHEKDKGYGHEEWLFDLEKDIDGYHYGLLQPAQRGRHNFLNKLFNVKLYSHNSNEKENLWIGEIKNLEVITKDEADMIYKIYQERGWIGEMTKQLKDIHADVKHFLKLEPHACFNVKFKPADARLYLPQREVADFKKTIGTYHYSFVRDKALKHNDEFSKEKPIEKRSFIFISGKSEKSLIKKVSRRTAKTVESEPVHNNIQEILYNYLVEKHGENFVGMEVNTGLGTFIDLAVEHRNGLTLYEVKSYASVTNSIRVALGQLIEYAFYPETIKNLKELIIVSHLKPNTDDIDYIKSIRENTSIKVYYQYVDISNRTVSQKW